jgi:hypothetical protein
MLSKMPPKSDVDEAYRASAREAALARHRTPDRLPADAESGLPGRRGSGRLVVVDGTHTLADRPVHIGDVIEVFTNPANGWVRGRFELSSGVAELIVNIWDPGGVHDEDGLPPWVGAWGGALPEGAICRWPV